MKAQEVTIHVDLFWTQLFDESTSIEDMKEYVEEILSAATEAPNHINTMEFHIKQVNTNDFREMDM